MLAIEIDGITHDYKLAKDAERQNELESLGIRFLRFMDDDIKKNTEGVLMSIRSWILENRDE